ncbi:PTS system, cellobiose-specific IIC component [Clostridium cavendishii DSM 21758]|uniref:Permease IIC component n=1 Tax=Clostridium cavendishii DSM 21758 TaxID=1121302 RepID=A0A1M6R3D1_9CLOT|nr:PTS transporter subunit EIIC [Clostridium cavendishii]SHK26964.1 PTS system, cellobiose-specific IIC component [Clostridium cavendishii DSM 21758]
MSSLSQFNSFCERKVMPFANKMAKQRHLAAMRDAFMSLLPITLMGGVAAILKSPPITGNTTNVFLLKWAEFATNNSEILDWLFTFTLGGMSLYISIGITHFLCKHYKIESFLPSLFVIVGFFLLVTNPIKLGYESKSIEIAYIDGKGLIPAILISILTVELYRFMKVRDFGRIKMPESVPASLSDVFAAFVPGFIIIIIYISIFTIFNKMGATLPKFLFSLLTPTFKAADSIFFVVIITLLTHLLWFFGIHDAALAGIMGPIRDGNLSINAAAQVSGQQLPNVFTTPFWVYFVAIGGCGAVLGLAILLTTAKSKQLKTIGKMGIVPAIFGISEPLIFGVPLMLNPVFLIPFIFAATINAIVAFLAMSQGMVEKTFSMLSWNMPSVVGAFFSTLDWKAVVLVIGLIIVDMIIYYPFFKIYDKQLLAQEE